MKKLFKTLSLLILASLFSCNGNNTEKSRMYFDKGIDLLYASRYEEAIENFDIAIKYNNQNYEAYFYRGCSKYNNFQKQEALEDFDKTIEINPEYAQAYFNIGLYYRSINDRDMACYYFRLAEEKGKANMEDYTKNCR